MSEILHYQDAFEKINIPEPERELALIAKNLFDIAHNYDEWNPDVHPHLNRILDTENVAQASWERDELENNNFRTYDKLALTVMTRGLTIALQHRDLNANRLIRTSLVMSDGASKVYVSSMRPDARLSNGSTAEQDIATFKDDFFETAASLGLYAHIQRLSAGQNESNSAILASAA